MSLPARLSLILGTSYIVKPDAMHPDMVESLKQRDARVADEHCQDVK